MAVDTVIKDTVNLPPVPQLEADGSLKGKVLIDYLRNLNEAISNINKDVQASTSENGDAIGVIKMFSGTWVDNVTMPGWYACIAANADKGCPDLVDKFVKGGSTSGATGGANSQTLTIANMPAHNHAPHVGLGYSADESGSGAYCLIDASKDNTVDIAVLSNTLGSGTAFDNQPSFYTLIYIRRCV